MTVKPYQSTPDPIGQFDILDTDLVNITGGEILVFDQVSLASGDTSSSDVYVDDGYRTLLRLAASSDVGPFFIADLGDEATDNNANFGIIGLQTPNRKYSNQSSKVSIYADDGFYSVSSDVVDSVTVNQDTIPYKALYSDSNGHITTTPSNAGATIGYFVEYQQGSVLRGFPNRLQYSAAHRENDAIIFYKSNSPIYLSNQIIVKQASDFGVIDSSKEYFIDGIVDMTGTGVSIEVPDGQGLKLAGYDFNTSKIICSDENYTLFTSPIGGSGDVLADDFSIEITGAGSKVWDVVDSTGLHAIEFSRINYNNCTSLGEMNGYRQGLETGTGRFGGTPTLKLSNAWAGGFRITTSIVRFLDDTMNAPLFEAGTGFSMNSRFLTDVNADLGATASLLDFAPTNFTEPSLLQIQGAIITRNGVSSADDATLIPNITESALESDWQNNQGLNNTFVGGHISVSSEVITTISGIGTFVDIAATWTTSNLQHFDNPAGGQLRHLGNNPREYLIQGNLTVAGFASDAISIKMVKWDDSESMFEDINLTRSQVNSLAGGVDVAFVPLLATVTLDQNDYVKMQITNDTATRDLTAKLDSFCIISKR